MTSLLDFDQLTLPFAPEFEQLELPFPKAPACRYDVVCMVDDKVTVRVPADTFSDAEDTVRRFRLGLHDSGVSIVRYTGTDFVGLKRGAVYRCGIEAIALHDG